jgi:tRNA (Thr-GGU) A37 N-methylase
MNLVHIGRVHSHLITRTSAPRQAYEGAPRQLGNKASLQSKLFKPGMDIRVLTWLHQADRNVLKTHPRSNPRSPLKGVFTTRSPDRPNPIGLHGTKILGISEHWIRVESLGAIDGTRIIRRIPPQL